MPFLNQQKGVTTDNILWSISKEECCRTVRGSHPRLPDQSDAYLTKQWRPAIFLHESMLWVLIGSGLIWRFEWVPTTCFCGEMRNLSILFCLNKSTLSIAMSHSSFYIGTKVSLYVRWLINTIIKVVLIIIVGQFTPEPAQVHWQ